MNEFMEVLNEYGWTVYYFTGFVTGCAVSLFIRAIIDIADVTLDVYKDYRLKKRGKSEDGKK